MICYTAQMYMCGFFEHPILNANFKFVLWADEPLQIILQKKVSTSDYSRMCNRMILTQGIKAEKPYE